MNIGYYGLSVSQKSVYHTPSVRTLFAPWRFFYQKEGAFMATYRNVQMSFWTDAKVIDDFTPEDKYFYLYLMTNPHTSLCGCYELSLSQIASETGYSKDTVVKLIRRFMEVHDLIRYDFTTKEIIILNWHKYNWLGSDKTMIAVQKGINSVKNEVFRLYLQSIANGNENVRIDISISESIPHSIPHSIPLVWGGYVTFMFISNNNNNFNIKENKEINKENDKHSSNIDEIVKYFNNAANKNYKTSSQTTRKHINARLNEGFTVEDFKTVIDKKVADWKNDKKMEQYLRPETLFGSKFESYLNQSNSVKEEFDIDKYLEGKVN